MNANQVSTRMVKNCVKDAELGKHHPKGKQTYAKPVLQGNGTMRVKVYAVIAKLESMRTKREVLTVMIVELDNLRRMAKLPALIVDLASLLLPHTKSA